MPKVSKNTKRDRKMNIAPNGRAWEFKDQADYWAADPSEDPPLLCVAGHTKSAKITGSNDGNMYPLYIRGFNGEMIKVPFRIKEEE